MNIHEWAHIELKQIKHLINQWVIAAKVQSNALLGNDIKYVLLALERTFFKAILSTC